jgi:hypothetical protein
MRIGLPPLVRGALAAALVIRRPPPVPPGHFYSPSTSREDIERARRSRRAPTGLNLRADEQVALVGAFDLVAPPIGRWKPQNDWFETADAAVLRALVLYFKPRRVVEIGSGYSTAVMLDLEGAAPEITCVEPNPKRLLSRLAPGDQGRLTIIPRGVQALAPEELAAMVEPGDFLIIDSTHVAKAGSDVCWLILHTLPLLQAGVFVHLHDIFWPFEYPDLWLEERRDWTEAYLLHAFLIENDAWEITLFNSYLWSERPEAIPAELLNDDPGSIWIRRRDRVT